MDDLQSPASQSPETQSEAMRPIVAAPNYSSFTIDDLIEEIPDLAIFDDDQNAMNRKELIDRFKKIIQRHYDLDGNDLKYLSDTIAIALNTSIAKVGMSCASSADNISKFTQKVLSAFHTSGARQNTASALDRFTSILSAKQASSGIQSSRYILRDDFRSMSIRDSFDMIHMFESITIGQLIKDRHTESFVGMIGPNGKFKDDYWLQSPYVTTTQAKPVITIYGPPSAETTIVPKGTLFYLNEHDTKEASADLHVNDDARLSNVFINIVKHVVPLLTPDEALQKGIINNDALEKAKKENHGYFPPGYSVSDLNTLPEQYQGIYNNAGALVRYNESWIISTDDDLIGLKIMSSSTIEAYGMKINTSFDYKGTIQNMPATRIKFDVNLLYKYKIAMSTIYRAVRFYSNKAAQEAIRMRGPNQDINADQLTKYIHVLPSPQCEGVVYIIPDNTQFDSLFSKIVEKKNHVTSVSGGVGKYVMNEYSYADILESVFFPLYSSQTVSGIPNIRSVYPRLMNICGEVTRETKKDDGWIITWDKYKTKEFGITPGAIESIFKSSLGKDYAVSFIDSNGDDAHNDFNVDSIRITDPSGKNTISPKTAVSAQKTRLLKIHDEEEKNIRKLPYMANYYHPYPKELTDMHITIYDVVGSNFKEMMRHHLVDRTITITENVIEASNLLGIEACYHLIVTKLHEIITANITANPFHEESFASVITVNGEPQGITIGGNAKRTDGPLKRSALARASTWLPLGAFYQIKEDTSGVAAAIIATQTPKIGTGISHIYYRPPDSVKNSLTEQRDIFYNTDIPSRAVPPLREVYKGGFLTSSTSSSTDTAEQPESQTQMATAMSQLYFDAINGVRKLQEMRSGEQTELNIVTIDDGTPTSFTAYRDIFCPVLINASQNDLPAKVRNTIFE